MDGLEGSSAASGGCGPAAHDGEHKEDLQFPALVDPFLVEALQNPRHRLTVLRMELDIQRFMQSHDQYQFEFQHFPTSYLRRAAHRVAQLYGLQTIALDNGVDGLGNRVIARKTPDSKFPDVCLSEVPAKQPEKEITEQVKIAIRPRPRQTSPSDDVELGLKKNATRTVEERKEEYDKARARIFNGSNSPEIEGSSSAASSDGRSLFPIRDELDCDRTIEEIEKVHTKDSAFRVAIFRDREKDRTDPDYDRSYDRFVKGVTLGKNSGLQACNIFQPPFLHYAAGIPQFGHLPSNQNSMSYNMSSPAMNPYCAGFNQNIKDAVYMQWPMMYVNSYEHFGHAGFQAPNYQQPLSFEHTQNSYLTGTLCND